MIGGLGASRYSFDLRAAKARDEINDALRMRSGMPQQPMMPQPMAPQMAPQPQMQPGMMPQQPQMAPGMAPQMGMQQPMMAQQPMMQQQMAPRPFQEGGLATSLRTNPVDHARDVAFVASRDQALRDMAGKRPFSHGGYAEGGDVETDIVVQGRRPSLNEISTFDLARLMGQTGGLGGAPVYSVEQMGGGAGGGALNASQRLPNLAYVEPKAERPAIVPAVVRSQTNQLADLAGMKMPRGYGATLRIGYAEGGGAWTRKEGQNPEGGLNAVGRASLKAQGHDIKPPVSAKQAKKSPKAAARRKSFCARMSGMPGPMKDDNGKPTRKALALRKWDC